MALETATTLSELDQTFPTGNDRLSSSDDHLRLIKRVLKLQFPSDTGNGFNKAITSSDTQLNYLDTLTSNVQTQLDAVTQSVLTLENDTTLKAPTGTRLLFHQAVAPTGWTQDVSLNDYAIRVVANTQGGQFVGTHSPISFSHKHATVSHALTVSEMPAHTHSTLIRKTRGFTENASNGVGVDYAYSATSSQASSVSGSSASHNHGETHVTAWTPKYTNVIIAVKD